jgi:effector-binding domain-containing protein
MVKTTFFIGEEPMTIECQLIDQSAKPALVIRTRAPVFRLAKVFGEAYAALEKYLAGIGEQPADAPFAAYFNMNIFSLDLAIGYPVHRTLPGKDKIQPYEIPGGKAAVAMHVGPYGKVGSVYKALDAFLRGSHLTKAGVCYEFYLNDPTNTPPDQLQTRVVFPLK